MADPRPRLRNGSPPQQERSTPARGLDRYTLLSKRPLHIMVFLLPLVILFEAGSALYLTKTATGDIETIRAHRLMFDFFEHFGVSSLYLPGILIVVVLLVWHVLLGESWRIRWRVIAGMWVESIAWTLPLLVLGQILFRMLKPQEAVAIDGALAGTVGPWTQLDWTGRMTIALGAGLYEELLFRMVAIAAIHTICVDLFRMKEFAGSAIAIVLAAAGFALYHDIAASGGGIAFNRLLFYFFAGLYFGVVYVARGFGIVVATHALYDVAVLVILAGD